MTRSRAVAATCSRCNRRCRARQLIPTRFGQLVCPKCFDRLPKGLRHTLTRQPKETAR